MTFLERILSGEDFDSLNANWALLSDKEQEAGEAMLRAYVKHLELQEVLTALVIEKIEELPDNVILLPSYVDKLSADLEPLARRSKL